jgi:hypothetical protein
MRPHTSKPIFLIIPFLLSAEVYLNETLSTVTNEKPSRESSTSPQKMPSPYYLNKGSLKVGRTLLISMRLPE